jgi:molecular chaperone GrpE
MSESSHNQPHDDELPPVVEQHPQDDVFADSIDAGVPTESRDDEMDRLRRTANEADKRVLQAQAEAENFRKRMRRDFEDQIRYASMPMVVDLLQVRDNLHRAIDAVQVDTAKGDAQSAVAGLKDGVSMVVKLLDDTLAKYGVVEIPAEGQTFDPNFHQAITQMANPDLSPGTIVHVATAGFKMHDRVVRPAQVIVSS